MINYSDSNNILTTIKYFNSNLNNDIFLVDKLIKKLKLNDYKKIKTLGNFAVTLKEFKKIKKVLLNNF